MKRISSFTENRIYELWFDGIPRDTIAQQLGVSGSTVSEIIGNLPENLKDLRKLSIELRRSRLSVSDAGRGAELQAKLTQLGVGPNQLQESIQAMEKICKEANYDPKKVVQAAIKLAKLEEQPCKSYTEILQDFQTKKNSVEELERREQELGRNIVEKEKEREQALAGNKLTEKEIAYVITLRQNLQQYGVPLENVEDLQRYLRSMEETEGNPRRFVQYTQEHDSLKRTLVQLRYENQREMTNLQRQQQEALRARDTKEALQFEISSLQKERSREQDELTTLRENSRRLQQEYQQGVTALAQLLKVEADAKSINEALASTAAKVHELDIEIDRRRKALQTLESRNQSIENEILGKLKIRDYATQLVTTIASLESEKAFLEKENGEKRERLALADTIAKFLTRIPQYDFDHFYYFVETVKRLREKGAYSLGLMLPIIEEQIRSEALKVFEKDLVSTKQHRELMEKYENCERERLELQKRTRELEAKNEEGKRSLECNVRDKQLLEALKVNFEGRPTTLAEVRNWTLSIFGEEIERRADEKFNAIAAVTWGGLDFFFRKITSGFFSHQSGQQ